MRQCTSPMIKFVNNIKRTMTCLLCFELNNDSIKLTSSEGEQHRLSSLLFKYFRFCFDNEPNDGELCKNCFQKLAEFHEFYVRIESVYEQVNKNKIAAALLAVKEEKIEIYEPQAEFNASNPSFKCEPVYWEDSMSGFGSTTQISIAESIHGQHKQLQLTKYQQRYETKKFKASTKRRVKKLRLLKCTIRQCAEEFCSQDDLNTHKIVTHKRIQCTHCPDMKLVLDLNTHLKNMHGIIQKTICEQCGQVFQSNASFLSHYKGVHEVHEPLQCDICKDWFKSRDSLRSHMTYVHIQGPQACPICGKVSTNRKSLLKHQLIHIESRKDRYKCIVCGKGFRDNTKLKEHSYIHSGVTDAYECNFCGKHFRFGSSLSAHRMKVHPLEMADVKNRLQWKRNLEFKI